VGKINGLKSAIEALQAVDEPTRLRIIKDISEKNPKIAAKLREGLFEFSDIQFFLKTDFQIIWWEVPQATWKKALRKAPPGVMKMIESFLSGRAFEQFKEDLQSFGPQPISQVLQAQKEIVDVIRHLVSQGKIAPPSSKKNDPLV
jgi:flagellar motor switch protein FliG